MKIHLEQLGEEPLNWREELKVSCEELGHPELLDLSRIQAHGTVGPLAPGYLLSASLAYEQTVSCDRCLGQARQPAAVDFSLLLLVAGQKEGGGEELELTADDLSVIELAEPVLDTRPLILEQVLLNVPMKPLCSEDCKGLCSRCGTDLNQGPCACREEADPRWAALAGLKKRLEQ